MSATDSGRQGTGALAVAGRLSRSAARKGAAQERSGWTWWQRLVSPLVLLVVWQLASTARLVSAQKLPPPTKVWHTAVELVTTNSAAYGTLQHALLVSLERMAIGFTLGASAALLLAIVAGLSRLGENAVDPVMQMARTVPLFGLTQLRGKKIAVAQGSSADYHLLTVLTKAGLTVHDVSLEYLQPAEGLAALNSGSVAAWDIWSPFIEQVKMEHGARVLVSGIGYGSNYSYVVASRAALGDGAKAAAIRDYIELLAQAHAWANTHPQAWAVQWAKATGLPLSVMVAAAKDDTATAAPITPQIVSAEQGLVNAFSAAGLIPSRYDFSGYAYSGFNAALSAGA